MPEEVGARDRGGRRRRRAKTSREGGRKGEVEVGEGRRRCEHGRRKEKGGSDGGRRTEEVQAREVRGGGAVVAAREEKGGGAKVAAWEEGQRCGRRDRGRLGFWSGEEEGIQGFCGVANYPSSQL